MWDIDCPPWTSLEVSATEFEEARRIRDIQARIQKYIGPRHMRPSMRVGYLTGSEEGGDGEVTVRNEVNEVKNEGKGKVGYENEGENAREFWRGGR